MIPKSTPYWNGHMDMRVHAARHFQWAAMVSFLSGVGEAIVDYAG